MRNRLRTRAGQRGPIASSSFLLGRWTPIRVGKKLGQRSHRLPHQKLRLAGHEVVVQLADEFVPKALVQSAGSRVVRRHAEKDVRELAEDELLGERDEARSDAAAARACSNADDLDVA